MVSKLQLLFPSHRLMKIDTPLAWQLRALLLVIADWPVERLQAAQQQATPPPPASKIEIEALSQTLARVLASRSDGTPQPSTDAEKPASLSEQQHIAMAPTPARAAPPRLRPQCAVECKREAASPSPHVCRKGSGGTVLPFAPAEEKAPWKRRARRRLASARPVAAPEAATASNATMLIPIHHGAPFADQEAAASTSEQTEDLPEQHESTEAKVRDALDMLVAYHAALLGGPTQEL